MNNSKRKNKLKTYYQTQGRKTIQTKFAVLAGEWTKRETKNSDFQIYSMKCNIKEYVKFESFAMNVKF